jgi:hypothetical protein
MSEYKDRSDLALMLSALSFVAWYIPLLGFPVAITGIILAIKYISHRGATARIVTALIILTVSLMVTGINSYIGAVNGYQAAQGSGSSSGY